MTGILDALLAALAALMSFGAAPPAEPIAWVGDSITAEWVDTHLAPGLAACGAPPVHFDAEWGRQTLTGHHYFGPYTSSGLDAAATLPDADRYIIELGTNDAARIRTPGDADHLIDTMLAALPADAEVTWVTVINRDHPAGADILNDAIRTHPRLDVWDWAEYATDRPAWFRDFTHPTPEGADAMTDFYCQALA